MKTEQILSSDVLDIVFENRNKAYGAYHLRKFYNNMLLKSIGVMMAIVMVLMAFTFIPKKRINSDVLVTGTTILTTLKKPDEIKVPEKLKTLTPPKHTAPTQALTARKIVDKLVIQPIKNLPDTIQISNKNSLSDNPNIIAPPLGTINGSGKEIEKSKPEVDINVPINAPEIMPSFPGGMEALRRFLQKNLINPRDLEEGENISVKMKFVIGYDGTLKSFETVEDGGDVFNKEVLRVLKKMPHWIPGKSKGQNVSVYYVIPIKFIAAN